MAFIKTREPGGTPAADLIRGIFASPPENDSFCMMTEALLISAARAQHVEKVIRPALTAGKWVLCDRYTDSTRVYQGILGRIESTRLESLIELSTDGLEPDLTFLLDCDVKVAAARRDQRSVNHNDAIKRYDDAKAEFHEQLRHAYLSLASRFPDRIVTINAGQPAEKVAAVALGILQERYKY